MSPIQIVNHNKVSPTLNVHPTLFYGGINDLYCCNFYHLPSDFSSNVQSSMTIFWPMDELIHHPCQHLQTNS